MSFENRSKRSRSQVKVIAVPDQENDSFEIIFSGDPGECILRDIIVGLRKKEWEPDSKLVIGDKAIWRVSLPIDQTVTHQTVAEANRIINTAFGLT